MKAAQILFTLGVVLILGSVQQSWSDSRSSSNLLHSKVKTFRCSVSVEGRTEYVKQGRSDNASAHCDYNCFEDFTLICKSTNDDQTESCPKLTALHFNKRRYDLSGKGTGTAIGLDVLQVISGGIDRRDGTLSYHKDERHTFQGDPVFLKTAQAVGACQPIGSQNNATKPRPVRKKPSHRNRDWQD